LFALVQGVHQRNHHVFGHGRIDFPGQFNEPRRKFVFARFPSQIERVDWNAVAAQARTRIEGGKAEGFRLGGLDHFPDVDTHPQAQQFQFVDERYVYGPISVFQDFGHLRSARGTNQVCLFEGPRIKRLRPSRTGGIDSSNDLRDLMGLELLIARILTLGREGQKEVSFLLFTRRDVAPIRNVRAYRALHAGFLQNRQHNLLGGTRICGALQHHQLAAP
jgi:hypothetical protein